MGVWLLLLALLLAAFVVLQVQRRRGRPAAPSLRPRTLFDLRTGDIVQFESADWVVEDRLLYEDDGFQWLEYLLRDGAEARWLVVCEDDWLEVSWLEAGPEPLARQLAAEADPFPPLIRWEGVDYALKEQGRARTSSSSRTMNRRTGACRYGDYGAEGQRLLSVERWDDDPPEITWGRRIDPALPVLLPGDGRSVYRPGA